MSADNAFSLSRRSLLATGFALSVQPVMAETLIHTDAAGLDSGEAVIEAGDRNIPGYWAAPSAPGTFPTIVVIHEIFGVHEWVKDVCRRLAKSGYFAVAPDLYVRQGEVVNKPDIDQVLAVVQKVPDSQVMSDIDSTLRWAGGTGKANITKIGVTGFCWGGREVWLYSAHNPKVNAGVAWYGPLAGTTNELKPTHPVDIAGTLTVPVLGLYGGADTGITADTVDQMRHNLRAGQGSEIIVFPDTPHGFAADYRPSYREGPAKDGWKKMLDWFKHHGVG